MDAPIYAFTATVTEPYEPQREALKEYCHLIVRCTQLTYSQYWRLLIGVGLLDNGCAKNRIVTNHRCIHTLWWDGGIRTKMKFIFTLLSKRYSWYSERGRNHWAIGADGSWLSWKWLQFAGREIGVFWLMVALCRVSDTMILYCTLFPKQQNHDSQLTLLPPGWWTLSVEGVSWPEYVPWWTAIVFLCHKFRSWLWTREYSGHC